MQDGDTVIAEHRSKSAKNFTLRPILIALAVALIAEVPMIYGIGGLFFDLHMIPGLLVLPAAAITWIIVLLINLVRLRWKTVLSVGAAGLVFVIFSAFIFIFAHDIRFQTVRPFYLTQIENMKREGKSTKLEWVWTGGYGYQETLEYDESDEYAPPPGKTEYVDDNCKEGVSGACGVHIRPMGGHFYLSDMYW